MVIRRSLCVAITSSLFVLLLLLADTQWANYTQSNLHHGAQPAFQAMNLFLYDRFFDWRASGAATMVKEAEYTKAHPENTILIFYLDKLTLNYARDHFHESFPWPRSRYVGILNDLKKAGARAVGLDVLFSSPGRGDRLLGNALRENRTITASRFVYVKKTIQGIERPVFRASRKTDDGFVDVAPDIHQIVRQSMIQLPTRFSVNPWSFDATLLREGLNAPLRIENNQLWFENVRFPLTRGKLMARKAGAAMGAYLASEVEPVYPRFLDINYTIPNCFVHAPLCSLWTKDRHTRLQESKNKIVLIGANAAEGIEIFGNDLFATPLGLMNGVELHAHILRTLLEHHPLIDFPNSTAGLIFLVLGIGFVYGIGLPAFKGWSRFFVGSLVPVLEAGFAYFLFRDHSVRLPLSTLLTSSFLDFGSVSYYFYILTKKEVDSVRHLFEGYLSPKVVSTLLENENRNRIRKQLAGHKQTATILYSDIRGFTPISEMLQPEEVVALLNEYFPPMTNIVYKLGGYLDKFIGDAIMAVFSAPFPQAEDPWLAVKAAVEMQKAVSRLGEQWEKQGAPKFEIGIGINTGEVVLGNVGSEHKRDYTVIGDSVNIASRLCNLAGGGQILISEATYELVKASVQVTSLGAIQVRGKKVPIQTYRVTSITGSPSGQ